jgi:signal peptide peptidase SppA
LGSEASLSSVVATLEKFNSSEAALSSRHDEDGEDNPVGYRVDSGVGVISITGPTLSSSNWITRYLGIVTYEDIKERVVEALEDNNVKEISFFIDSPGGSAKGVKSLSSFVSKAGKLKSTTAFSEGTMSSAALWYGTASNEVVLDEDSTAGSLGAIAVHTSIVEMRKRDGIEDTILRTAENKALGHPLEKLSDKAKEKLMEGMNFLHDSFVEGIALNRSLQVSTVNNKIATGDVFRASKAVSLGLADRIDSAEGVLYSLVQKAAKASGKQSRNAKLSATQSEEELNVKRKGLSTAVLAALAAGVPIENLQSDIDEQGSEQESSTDVVELEASPAEQDASTEQAVTAVIAAPKDSELVSFLKSSLEAANLRISDLSMASASLIAETAELNKTVSLKNSELTALRVPLIELTTRFAVACNVSLPDLQALDTLSLLASYKMVNDTLLSNFGKGQVTKTTGEVETPKPASTPVARASKATTLGSK